MSSTADADDVDPLDQRDADALTQVMTVLDDADAVDDELPLVRGVDDIFLVVHVDEYVVDLRTQTCTCDDFFFRPSVEACKHIRRVEYAIGEREIPTWVDPSAIDDGLGDHVSTDY
jgi:predicted nucleic acid-binding Zn finger protein